MLSWLNSDLPLFINFQFSSSFKLKGFFKITLLKNDCTVFLVHSSWFGNTYVRHWASTLSGTMDEIPQPLNILQEIKKFY